MDIEKRVKELEKRVSLLEQGRGAGNEPPVIEMDLLLPEADIDGLHFNETKVNAVFDRLDDGWYYSRDILFASARNIEENNSRDILMEYLVDGGGDSEIRAQIADVFGVQASRIELVIPKKSQGTKQYNGVDYCYWLDYAFDGSGADFSGVNANGYSEVYNASCVGGCAPAFRVSRGGNL
jgi:hypothetical protein